MLVAVRRRAVSGVRAVVIVPVVTGLQAIGRTVIAPVVIGARAVTVPVAAAHSRWRPRSS